MTTMTMMTTMKRYVTGNTPAPRTARTRGGLTSNLEHASMSFLGARIRSITRHKNTVSTLSGTFVPLFFRSTRSNPSKHTTPILRGPRTVVFVPCACAKWWPIQAHVPNVPCCHSHASQKPRISTRSSEHASWGCGTRSKRCRGRLVLAKPPSSTPLCNPYQRSTPTLSPSSAASRTKRSRIWLSASIPRPRRSRSSCLDRNPTNAWACAREIGRSTRRSHATRTSFGPRFGSRNATESTSRCMVGRMRRVRRHGRRGNTRGTVSRMQWRKLGGRLCATHSVCSLRPLHLHSGGARQPEQGSRQEWIAWSWMRPAMLLTRRCPSCCSTTRSFSFSSATISSSLHLLEELDRLPPLFSNAW
mmetsp:Transcript_29315/g.70312  ORF Transcript_29315/g.70312 Transcript_29315/m.70312 type:complete len:360 (+) Transcript_29315:667-1746(+)